MNKRLLTDREAREHYGLRSLPQWRVAGYGPAFIKAGRRVYYEPDAIEAWLSERRRTSTSDNGQVAA